MKTAETIKLTGNNKNKSAVEGIAQIVFTIPPFEKKLRTRRRDTNCGTAIVTINKVLHIFGNFVLALLIRSDNKIPPIYVVKVAKNAHTSVQPKTRTNA